MRRLTNGLIILALLLLIAVAATAQVRPQCTGRGWYLRADSTVQYPVWDYADPAMAGRTTQALGAHSWTIWGSDGIQYAILDQCHADQNCTGLQGTYKRPADAIAAAEWDRWYTAADAQTRRQAFGYYNVAFVVPIGTQAYVLHTLAELQPGFQYSLGLAYACPGVVPHTPVPAGTPVARTPTRRPPAPTVNPCAVLPGGVCPPTAPPIVRTLTPKPPVTNAPTRTGTATATLTAAPSPIRTTEPPLVVTVAPTKVSGGSGSWFSGCRVAPQPTPAP